MSDELRNRLSRVDPAPTAPTSLSRELLETTMSNDLLSHAAAVPASRRRWLPAAAAAVLVGGVGVALTVSSGDEPGTAPTTTRLALPDPTAMASCVPFEVRFLRDMSPAFAGTATSVTDREVVLDVDRWYTGGDADQVVLALPGQGTTAALDGVAFSAGERYLVTAADGTVNGCGFSGPATAERQAAYDEAYGS